MSAQASSEWAGTAVNIELPSIARIYDYLLGGYHNFEVDRQRARLSLEIYPDVALSARVNRAFLRRAVAYMLGQGITQFLDLGSGIPTVSHVHEIAQRHDPQSRVVYVDIDPVAVAQSKSIIGDDPRTFAFQEDARHPERIMAGIHQEGMLDFGKAIGILMIALLHFVPDTAEARDLVCRYAAYLAPGSYLAFTHGTYENTPPGAAEGLMKLSQSPIYSTTYRTQAEIQRLFDTLDFVPPGIVFTPLWQPESDKDLMHDEPGRSLAYAGVARIGVPNRK